MKYTHDVVIIGGGAGGLSAASGCVQLGMKTALIEKELMGGDCLYYGCVPSKTLLKSAKVYSQAGNLENAQLSLFADGSNGDLHLASSATEAIDQGAAVAAGLCDDDIDGEPRDSSPDIGADEVQ